MAIRSALKKKVVLPGVQTPQPDWVREMLPTNESEVSPVASKVDTLKRQLPQVAGANTDRRDAARQGLAAHDAQIAQAEANLGAVIAAPVAPKPGLPAAAAQAQPQAQDAQLNAKQQAMQDKFAREKARGATDEKALDVVRKTIFAQPAGEEARKDAVAQKGHDAAWNKQFPKEGEVTDTELAGQKKPAGMETWVPMNGGFRPILSLPPIEATREDALARSFGENMRMKRDASGAPSETFNDMVNRRRDTIRSVMRGATPEVSTDPSTGTRSIAGVGSASNPAWASENTKLVRSLQPAASPSEPLSDNVWNQTALQNKIDDKSYLGEPFTGETDMAQRGVANMVQTTLPPVIQETLAKDKVELPKYNL